MRPSNGALTPGAVSEDALPHTTLLFHAALAVVLALAWASLGAQLDVLVGSRGLVPAADEIAFLRMQPWASWLDYPSLFWFGASDAALHAGALAGFLLAVCALVGVYPRVCFLLSAVLYASYVVTCDVFTTFQWDSMLLETCVLAAWMPRDRRSLVPLLLVRALFFKLYVESGIAKLESPAHDWEDGSAMRSYYETAPLPSLFAYYAHHLPAWWHWVESQGTLVLELAVPLGAFLPRRPRYVAGAALTLFQALNLLTASYGFFVWMSLTLHLTLLADDDVASLARGVVGRFPALSRLRRPLVSPRARPLRLPPAGARLLALLRPVPVSVYAAAWALASLAIALVHFSDVPAGTLRDVADVTSQTHLANPYHLFTSITTVRVEPQLETTRDGERWTEHDMHWKPGDPMRAPGWAAPHQPRVDFRLWFYGLGFRGDVPAYVDTLLDRVCHDPDAVQSLYVRRLPHDARAARMAFFQYHFATAELHARTGAWWTRERLAATEPLDCGR